MKTVLVGSLVLGLLVGCASSKQEAAKVIHERPWIGGKFETVPTPLRIQTNAPGFGKWAALITDAPANTPVQKAGLVPGDLALTINNHKIHRAQDVARLVEKESSDHLAFTIYRDGAVIEKSVEPGVERFQNFNTINFGIGLSSSFKVDLFPNPDFSLVAIGYEKNNKRLDTHSTKGAYLKRLQDSEHPAQANDTWQGLRSAEGWKAWLGPISWAQNKIVVSQETTTSK